MIVMRPSEERGFEDKGWLQSYHTFSFNTYYDPDFVGFRSLRVINEDTVKGGKGFGSHNHSDMEILTYVLEGALEHRDSLGNTRMISQGEVQQMSAGTGIVHSEYNLSHQMPVHFLQIWIQPNQVGLTPSYAQKAFTTASKWGQWCLVASRNGRGGSLMIHQDADLYSTILDQGDELVFEGLADRGYYVHIVSGKFLVLGVSMKTGDGAFVTEELSILFKCQEGGELLLFDLA